MSSLRNRTTHRAAANHNTGGRGGAKDFPRARRLLALLVSAAIGVALASDPAGLDWRRLAPGLEFANVADRGVTFRILRIDPQHWQTVALAVSATGGEPRSAREWGQEFGLAAVINAGMFATDRRTHTGYFHTGSHVNNGVWVRRDYRQAACFEPRTTRLPRFALVDLDSVPPDSFVHRYEIVVQNLRLISRPGENRWEPSPRRWSEACLGEDAQGRMLWIFCRQPLAMHELNDRLLALPLSLVAAQHLEGGPGAQLWLNPETFAPEARAVFNRDFNLNESNTIRWPVPNVLGIRPRSDPPSSSE